MALNTAVQMFDRMKELYKDRKYVYVFRAEDDMSGPTYQVVNYDAINRELNSFLALFDISGKGCGYQKQSEDGQHSEIWYQVDEEFSRLVANTYAFRAAFAKLGVELVFDYPFKKKEEPWTDDWKGWAKAGKYMMNWLNGEE